MNCTDFQKLIHAALDGELEASQTAEIEQHIRSCPRCAAARENLQRMKSALADSGLYFNAPQSLSARIRAALPATVAEQPFRSEGQGTGATQHSAGSGLPHLLNWLKWLGALGTTALVAVLVTLTVLHPSAREQLASDVAAGHFRSLIPGHLTDVASTDLHTVKPWLDARLDFTPPTVDLADDGFSLVGARLDYLDHRTVAALVYQRNKHVINLFVWPSTTNGSESQIAFARNGCHIVHWHQGGMSCWAVSDLDESELSNFARAFEKHKSA